MRKIALLSAFVAIASLTAGEPPVLPRSLPELEMPALEKSDTSLAHPKPIALEIRIYPVGDYSSIAPLIEEFLLSPKGIEGAKFDYYPAVDSLVVCDRGDVHAALAEVLPALAAEQNRNAKKLLILQRAYERSAVNRNPEEAKRIALKILEIDPLHFAKPQRLVQAESKPAESVAGFQFVAPPPPPAKLPDDVPNPADLEFLRKALVKPWEPQAGKIEERK